MRTSHTLVPVAPGWVGHPHDLKRRRWAVSEAG